MKIYVLAGLVACVVGSCIPPIWNTNFPKDRLLFGRKWYIFAESVLLPTQAISLRCATATLKNSTDPTKLNINLNFVNPGGQQVQLKIPGTENPLGSGKFKLSGNAFGDKQTARISVVCGGSTDGKGLFMGVMDCDPITGKKALALMFTKRVTKAEPLTKGERILVNECLLRTAINPNSINIVENENCPNF